jgi:HSP20 family molecular chaperone IbpA
MARQASAPAATELERTTMYRSLFPRDLFAELDRLQRDMSGAFDYSPAIRGLGRGGYPALNVGSTSTGVEVFAFAPGIDPATLDIQLDRGVLTIAGERRAAAPRGQRREGHAAHQRTFCRALPPRGEHARRHRPRQRHGRVP